MKKEPIAIIGAVLTLIATAAPQAVDMGLVTPEIASLVVAIVGIFGTAFGRSKVSPVKR